MKYTILTILLFEFFTSCGNAQKKDNKIENEYVFKKDFCKEIVVGGVVGIENKCYKVNEVVKGTLQNNEYVKVRLRPYVNEDETGLTQNEINDRRRLSSQEFIEIPIDYLIKKEENKIEKESKEVPPNGTFIFTVKDFETSKTGKWKVVIKGNKATIYSLGQEIWDTTVRKGDLISKTNIIKHKGKWISVNDNELDKDFEVINGGQFVTWDFKNKVIGTF